MAPNPLRRTAAPVTEGDLTAFESRTGLTLPPAYRAFLLDSNGGVPRRGVMRYTTKMGKTRDATVRAFFPLGRDGLTDADRPDLEQAHATRPVGLPANLLLVADADSPGGEGFIALGVGGGVAGKVFFRPAAEPEKATLHAVAKDWGTFFAGLKPEGKPEPWRDAILDGDTEALQRWLTDNRELWDGHELADRIRRAALEEDSWEAVSALLDSGLAADALLWDALGANRFGTAARLLATGAVPAEGLAGVLHVGTPRLWGQAGLVNALIDAGADVGHADRDGRTPMHRAVAADSAEGVRLLAGRGADPTIPDDQDIVPMELVRPENAAMLQAMREVVAAWAASQPPEPPFEPLDLRGVAFRRAGPGLTPDEIRAFEAEFKVSLPPEYRGLLMRVNGGTPSFNSIPVSPPFEDEYDNSEWEERESLVSFLVLRKEHAAGLPPEEGEDGEEDEKYVRSVQAGRDALRRAEKLPRGLLPIGWLDEYGEGAWLVLRTRGKDRGRLFAFDYETTDLGMTLGGLFEMLAAAATQSRSPGETLADAVEARDLEGVRAAVAGGAANKFVARDGREPVRLAVKAGFAEAVALMAVSGFDAPRLLDDVVDAVDPAVVSCYLDALPAVTVDTARFLLDCPAVYRDAALLERLLATGVTPAPTPDWMDPPLHTAAGYGTPETVRRLIDAGYPASELNRFGMSPLHRLCSLRDGDHVGIIALFREHGVPADGVDYRGMTPLHEALKAGNLPVALALIDAGADPFRGYDIPMPEQRSGPGLPTRLLSAAMNLADAPVPGPDGDGVDLARGGLSTVGYFMDQFERRLADRRATSLGTALTALEFGRRNSASPETLARVEEYARQRGLG